jgi:predicted RNA-binding Zn-ribbon protein involved in translation (DUF1610 family)
VSGAELQQLVDQGAAIAAALDRAAARRQADGQAIGAALDRAAARARADGLAIGAALQRAEVKQRPWPSTCPRCGRDKSKRGPGTFFECRWCGLDGGDKEAPAEGRRILPNGSMAGLPAQAAGAGRRR